MSVKARVCREETGICNQGRRASRGDRAAILSIDTVTGVRVLIRYDIENLSEEYIKQALVTILSEPPVD